MLKSGKDSLAGITGEESVTVGRLDDFLSLFLTSFQRAAGVSEDSMSSFFFDLESFLIRCAPNRTFSEMFVGKTEGC